MSGKFVFVTSLVGVSIILFGVHWQQQKDRQDMKKGVERDKLKLAIKKNKDHQS
jgi:hypothetical protein